MPEPVTVVFVPSDRKVEVADGRSLLEAARTAGIPLAAACGGEGRCGRCRVTITRGDVPTASQAERRALGRGQLAAGQRLACRVAVHGFLCVEVPRASTVEDACLQTDGTVADGRLEPAVRRLRVAVEPPTLVQPRSDLERVSIAAAAVGAGTIHADPSVVRDLPSLLRGHSPQVELLLRGRRLVGAVAPGGPLLGYAVDLGTTKIAGYLLELDRGRTLASMGALNPQASFGSDVISRLSHAVREPSGPAVLARVVRHALDELLGRLCASAGVERRRVADGCIVGNTVMHHLLLELPTRQLAQAPFVAATSTAVDVRARDLGLEMASDARVHILPGVAGFVGGDAVATTLATDLDRVSVVKLVVDIGTNTEIALRGPRHKHLIVASCASGPAFEGGHLQHGMSAGVGAIDEVVFEPDGRTTVHTIDEAPALGICGSGVVDAIAGMWRSGMIGPGGRLVADAAGVRQGEHGLEVLLAGADRSATDDDIVVTQADIGEIQLAKGAIAAGIETVLKETATPADAVEEVELAGAFGTYLDIDNALAIGLLPNLPNAAYVQIGNAAGIGAQMALRSVRDRSRAQAIADTAEYIELTTRPAFRARFARTMRFADDVGANEGTKGRS